MDAERADPHESYAPEHHSRLVTHHSSAGCASASRYVGGGGVEWSHRGIHRIAHGTVLTYFWGLNGRDRVRQVHSYAEIDAL